MGWTPTGCTKATLHIYLAQEFCTQVGENTGEKRHGSGHADLITKCGIELRVVGMLACLVIHCRDNRVPG